MSNVVAFPGRNQGPQAEGPYLEGPVRCVRCKHEWRGVSPVGEFEGLECPACHNETGVRYTLVGPDGEHWVCNCGSSTFALARTGAPICVNCGRRANSWAEG